MLYEIIALLPFFRRVLRYLTARLGTGLSGFLYLLTLTLRRFRGIRFGNNANFVQKLYSVLRGSSCFEKFLLVGNPITRLDTAWKQNRSVLYGQVMMLIEEHLYRIVVRVPAVCKLLVFDADFFQQAYSLGGQRVVL